MLPQKQGFKANYSNFWLLTGNLIIIIPNLAKAPVGALTCHGWRLRSNRGRETIRTGAWLTGCSVNNDDKWRSTSKYNVFLFSCARSRPRCEFEMNSGYAVEVAIGPSTVQSWFSCNVIVFRVLMHMERQRKAAAKQKTNPSRFLSIFGKELID